MHDVEDYTVLEKQLDFMRAHVTSPKGNKFSSKNRETFIYWYLGSLNGWKIGKNVKEFDEKYADTPVCSGCAERLGELTFDFTLKYTCPESHCVGLRAWNIWFIFLHADRRTGKTFTTGSHIIERLCQGRNYRARYIASGHDHTKELSAENIEGIVTRNEEHGDGRMAQAIEILKGKALTNKFRNNKLTLVSSSGAANLGAGLSEIFVDEAKVVPFDTVNKLLPSIQEMHGWKCVACGWEHAGHMKAPTQCPTCGKGNIGLPVAEWTLLPWNARAVFMSNAGTISGDAMYDWFDTMVDDLLIYPHPNIEVGRFNDNTINPDVNPEVKAIAVDLISRVPGLEGHKNEWENEAKSIGQPFVETWNHIYFKGTRENIGKSYEQLIVFVDMARTVDLVSVTAMRDATPKNHALTWEFLENVYTEWWDPQDAHNGISLYSAEEKKRVVNEDLLFAKLHDIFSQWPNITLGWVDTRFSRLGEKILERLQKVGAPYSKRFFAYEGRGDERSAAYTICESKINNQRILMQFSQRLDSEFKKAVWVMEGNKMSVRERGRSHNEKSRRKNHLDLLEGMATVCLMSHELRDSGGVADNIRKSRAGVMGNNTLGRNVPKQIRNREVDRHIVEPENDKTFHMTSPSKRERLGTRRENITRQRLQDF